MIKNKTSISFKLSGKKNKAGEQNIRCIIRVNKTSCEFRTGEKCKKINWVAQNKMYKVKFFPEVTNKLNQIKTDILAEKAVFDKNKMFFTAKEIFNSYQETFKPPFIPTKKEYNIFFLFEQFISQKKQAFESNLITWSAVQKYFPLRNHFYNFLKTENYDEQTPLKNIYRGMFEKFKIFLFGKNFKNNHISKMLSNLVGVFAWGVDNEFLEKNPFKGLTLRKERSKKIFLSVQEIEILENKNFEILRLEKIKNLFLLSCYTGLAFADLTQLSKTHLCEVENVQCLIIHRQKTDSQCIVPLMDKAKIILDKYNYNLQVPTNQKYNAYLKEIQVICGIDKKLCTHTGRKTFINIMLNKHNVPSESVMKMVGHQNLKTTYGYYAEIDSEKVVNDFKNIKF